MDIVEQLRATPETGADPDIIFEAADEIERLRAAMLDFRYSHDEIEYACGGEVAMSVREKVMARRARIVTPNAK